MGIKVTKHIHKLKRRKLKNREIIYFCVLDCKFRVHRDECLGKKTICWVCNKVFEMNTYSNRLDRPRCPDCVGGAKPKDILVFGEMPGNVEKQSPVSITISGSTPASSLRERLLKSISDSVKPTGPIDTHEIKEDLL